MRVAIKKSNILGSVTAPPSKSMAHRLLICAGLSCGVCKVQNIAYSDDVIATIDCLNALGVKCEKHSDYVIVYGSDILNNKISNPLNCNECGSTLRFFIPIALLLNQEITLKGSEKLISRPLNVYERLAQEKGFTFKKDKNSVTVKGKLTCGEYNIVGNVSSQFISGLLFALSLTSGDSIINLTTELESRSYVNLTLSALNSFGIKAYFENPQKIVIVGGTYKPQDIIVEGDYSNAAFLDAFNYYGGNVQVDGLNPNSLQGDKVYLNYFEQLKTKNAVLDISNCPDLGPILFALAAYLNGAKFIGTKRLSIKESDRATAMAQELSKFGVKTIVEENSVEIIKSDFHPPNTSILGHNDHRIVMALTTLLTRCGGEIIGAEAVNKSYPEFFETIKALNCEMTIYETE